MHFFKISFIFLSLFILNQNAYSIRVNGGGITSGWGDESNSLEVYQNFYLSEIAYSDINFGKIYSENRKFSIFSLGFKLKLPLIHYKERTLIEFTFKFGMGCQHSLNKFKYYFFEEGIIYYPFERLGFFLNADYGNLFSPDKKMLFRFKLGCFYYYDISKIIEKLKISFKNRDSSVFLNR